MSGIATEAAADIVAKTWHTLDCGQNKYCLKQLVETAVDAHETVPWFAADEASTDQAQTR